MSADEIIEGIREQADGRETVDNIWLIEAFNLLVEVGELILGLLVVIILMLVPLVVAMEVMYINLPLIRGAFDKVMNHKWKASSVMRFACRDAVEAVTKAEITQGNANMNYLIIKSKSVMLIGFTVAIVLQGTSMMLGITNGIAGEAIELFLSLLK